LGNGFYFFFVLNPFFFFFFFPSVFVTVTRRFFL